MPASPDLLISAIEGSSHTFPDVLDAIYKLQYSGQVIINFSHGVATVVDVPIRTTTRIPLTVPKKPAKA